MTLRRACETSGTALLVVAVAAPPIVALGALLARWSVDVPAWDEWLLGPMLTNLLDGRLALADLWRPHNEHRPLVSRVLLLGLARASGWNVYWELAANVVVQCVSYLAFTTMALGAARGRARLAMLPAIAACGWLLFSPVQWENWMWGWQLAIFAMVCACALLALGLARWRGGWLGFGGMWLAAVAGALSFASGLALVALLPLAIAVHPAAGARRRRAIMVCGAVALALVVLLAYGAGLHLVSPTRPPPVNPFADWFLVGFYLLVNLGAPLGLPDLGPSMRWGAAGLVLLAAGWLALPRAERRSGVVVGWMLVAMVAIASGLMTATGRGGYGIFGALISRYTSIALLLWVALVFLWNHVLHLRLRTAVVTRTTVALAALVAAVSSLGVVGYREAARSGIARTVEHHLTLIERRECAVGLDRAPPSCVELLFRGVDVVRSALPLAARGYGLAREVTGPSIADWRATPAPREPGRLDVVDAQAAEGFVRVLGWAWNPFRREAAAEVLLAVDGRVVQRVPIGRERPDVQAPRPAVPLHVGFETRLARFRFPPGEHEVTAWLVHHGDTRVVRLPGEGRFVTEAVSP